MLFGKKNNKSIHEDRIIVNEKAISGKVEGYNRLKDNILYLNADGKTKVIQVESSVMHEGKTTVASNLAVSLGLTDKKVVVVDLDFRKANVHRRFDLHNDKGLAEYMLGTIGKDELIQHSKYKNVDVISRGGKVYNPSVILVSDKFKTLMNELRDEYDYVILDCAPVLQVSDYINILSVADGVLFLVAYGMTSRNQVSDAIKELRKNGARLLGSVFTMYDRKKDKGYGYGYGKYYGKGYYSYYRSYIDENSAETEDAAKETPEETTENKDN
ncbi:MAG: CpsD/CapB family tyrosine-protein kinase [Clostridia bacterium]|nr:CpsD/CapB family tyrosine-protein kinase [Clostridia bacterium]